MYSERGKDAPKKEMKPWPWHLSTKAPKATSAKPPNSGGMLWIHYTHFGLAMSGHAYLLFLWKWSSSLMMHKNKQLQVKHLHILSVRNHNTWNLLCACVRACRKNNNNEYHHIILSEPHTAVSSHIVVGVIHLVRQIRGKAEHISEWHGPAIAQLTWPAAKPWIVVLLPSEGGGGDGKVAGDMVGFGGKGWAELTIRHIPITFLTYTFLALPAADWCIGITSQKITAV